MKSGPPLGAFAHATYPVQCCELRPDDTVVLYSDGLIERPGTIITNEIERLRRTAADAETNDPEELADHLLSLAGPRHRLRDDVALLTFRPAPDLLDLAIPASRATSRSGNSAPRKPCLTAAHRRGPSSVPV